MAESASGRASSVHRRACPFTAGYWAFLHRKEPRLRANHRIAQPLNGLRRLADIEDVAAHERDRDRC